MLNQHKILRVFQLITYLQEKPHKAVGQLATFMETTERTVYRYLDLLRECGFDLHKDANQRFYIEKEDGDGIHFSNEEAQFLKELVLTSGKHSRLKDAVLSKIYTGSELAMVAGHLIHAKNGKIIERLTRAMINKEQVTLKKYQSINTETISDRVVEPFGFNENYQTVMAYEPASKKNKTYNIDRIGSVEFSAQSFLFEANHEQQVTDVFGFAYSGQKFPIHLEMTMKQYLLLKDQYPLIAPFVKYFSGKDKYVLEVKVNDLRPVERFEKESS
jgi:predicted DNA-binding transcriptional regulator YafY